MSGVATLTAAFVEQLPESCSTRIVDTRKITHGCFGNYIEGFREDGDVFGRMDGKGVFLYATRGAPAHLSALLAENGLTIADVDLLIEHQANFALIPMTIERVLDRGQPDPVEPGAHPRAARRRNQRHDLLGSRGRLQPLPHR